MSTISERLDILIKELGMNKNSFSKAIGLSNNSTITNIINNPGRTPSYHVIFRIANTFENINVRWLISGKGSVFATGTDSYSEINDRLAHIHRKEFISLSKAAQVLKVQEDELKDFFYHNKPASKKLVNAYIKAFPQINPDWIKNNKPPMYMEGTGVTYATHEKLAEIIPKIGEIDSSIKDLFECPDAKPVEILRFQSILENDIIMEVHTNNMEPEYIAGDLLLCKEIKKNSYIFGSSYFIITGDCVMLRSIQSSNQVGHLKLITHSKDVPPMEISESAIKSIFSIVGLIRRFMGSF